MSIEPQSDETPAAGLDMQAVPSENGAHAALASPPLWSALSVVAPLAARVDGAPGCDIYGISIDTRSLAEGDLFFAIKGERSDGHDYVRMAFEKGAAAAVVDDAHADLLKGLGRLYVVREVLPALERLARAARARTAARIVAVTGSVGKTSTKEALRLALSKESKTIPGAVHASVASYNNHWGVPVTLARMPRDTRFGIFEIGMNHAGEIRALVDMVRPHIAIVTSVAPVHLEFFRDLAAIADAKAEIFSGLRPGGVAIINRDLETFERLATHARQSPAGHIATFGEDRRSDAQLLNLHIEADRSLIEARIGDRHVTYALGAPGRHLALNSLAVLLAAQALGMPLEEAAAALADFAPPAGRGERFTLQAAGGPFTLVDESYNANPASMRAALALAGALPAKRRIAVLGDMRELGASSAALHAGLAADIGAGHIDVVFAAGPLMAHLFEALPAKARGAWRDNAADLVDRVAETIRAGDLVVVKGSNASRMGDIAKALKARFAAPPDTRRDDMKSALRGGTETTIPKPRDSGRFP